MCVLRQQQQPQQKSSKIFRPSIIIGSVAVFTVVYVVIVDRARSHGSVGPSVYLLPCADPKRGRFQVSGHGVSSSRNIRRKEFGTVTVWERVRCPSRTGFDSSVTTIRNGFSIYSGVVTTSGVPN
uniref:(northern house mosquito) hypothetical protein n=1 Tax=Culex pipiens TaxID=7175 RepID=A0A8D8JCQ9_CULPI